MGVFTDTGNDKWFIDLIHSPSIFFEYRVVDAHNASTYQCTYLLFGLASKHVRCSDSFVSKWSGPTSLCPFASSVLGAAILKHAYSEPNSMLIGHNPRKLDESIIST